MLPEEEADCIAHTFPGLSPPILSPTEPTVGPQRAQRALHDSNPLRAACDFSQAASQQAAPAGPRSPETGLASEESTPDTLSGGISDLSLPLVSTPGASTPVPRGSVHRTHERPWDTMHTHDNVLFSDQSPGADGAGASGGGASTKAAQLMLTSVQKTEKLPDADVERHDARMPSPDENSSENLLVQAK